MRGHWSGRPPPGGRHAGLATGGLVSERANLLRLRALLALGDLELDPLVLLQSAVPARLDGREVDEHVSTPAVDGDEAEALVCVEPLHGSLRHAELSLLKMPGPMTRGRCPFSSSGALEATFHQDVPSVRRRGAGRHLTTGGTAHHVRKNWAHCTWKTGPEAAPRPNRK